MGIELMQGINTWPRTAEDMIDRLIAGYSTGLGVLIDTITYSGFHSGAVNRQAAGMTYAWHWDQLTYPLMLVACKKKRKRNRHEAWRRFKQDGFFLFMYCFQQSL